MRQLRNGEHGQKPDATNGPFDRRKRPPLSSPSRICISPRLRPRLGGDTQALPRVPSNDTGDFVRSSNPDRIGTGIGEGPPSLVARGSWSQYASARREGPQGEGDKPGTNFNLGGGSNPLPDRGEGGASDLDLRIFGFPLRSAPDHGFFVGGQRDEFGLAAARLFVSFQRGFAV